MKFKLKTTKSFYSDKHPMDVERVERLRGLGFDFERRTILGRESLWIEDELLPEIEIADLNALMEFVWDWGDIVLSEDTIEIYNDWRE